jgi:hypothetical protein
MKTGKSGRLLIYLFVIVLSSAVWVTVTAAAETDDLDESSA